MSSKHKAKRTLISACKREIHIFEIDVKDNTQGRIKANQRKDADMLKKKYG
jgi:hypothetical protein